MTALVALVLVLAAVTARRLTRSGRRVRVTTAPSQPRPVQGTRVDATVLEQLEPPFQRAARVLRQAQQ